jgi:small conductance mechanosensitive channel
VLIEAIKNTTGVLVNPAPSVAVTELGDSSVNLALRAYGSPQDQASIQSLLMENAKKALDTASIEIPYPQRVITMIKE